MRLERLRHPFDGATVPPAGRKLRRCPHSSTFTPPEAVGAQTTPLNIRVSSGCRRSRTRDSHNDIIPLQKRQFVAFGILTRVRGRWVPTPARRSRGLPLLMPTANSAMKRHPRSSAVRVDVDGRAPSRRSGIRGRRMAVNITGVHPRESVRFGKSAFSLPTRSTVMSNTCGS